MNVHCTWDSGNMAFLASLQLVSQMLCIFHKKSMFDFMSVQFIVLKRNEWTIRRMNRLFIGMCWRRCDLWQWLIWIYEHWITLNVCKSYISLRYVLMTKTCFFRRSHELTFGHHLIEILWNSLVNFPNVKFNFTFSKWIQICYCFFLKTNPNWLIRRIARATKITDCWR